MNTNTVSVPRNELVFILFCRLKDDVEIKDSRHCYRKRDGSKHTLFIVNANLDDDAEYTCRARNSSGKAECAAEVLVESK